MVRCGANLKLVFRDKGHPQGHIARQEATPLPCHGTGHWQLSCIFPGQPVQGGLGGSNLRRVGQIA